MSFNQGEFNFDAENGENGYDHWQEELERQKSELESCWGIILGKKVSLLLRDYTQPFIGIIEVDEYAKKPTETPRLRLKNQKFFPTDIESVSRAD